MQQPPNNDLYSFPSERKKGIIGAIVIHGIVFALLFIITLKAIEPQSEEGILVNFGMDDTGFGMIEPSQPASAQEAYVPPAASEEAVTVPSEEEPVMTQNFEEAPEVKEVDPEAERRREEAIEAEKRRQEQLEIDRVRREQEEAERQRVEAERQRQADIMNRTRNAFANAQNTGTSSTSEGVAGGEGNQGSPTGSVNSQNRGEGSGLGNKGFSYDLSGRSVANQPPTSHNCQSSGRVVVSVRVNKDGKVLQAEAGAKGSTTLDDCLLRVAREKALQTVFSSSSSAPEVQVGTITFNFVLN